ncbi:hypothetical protein V5P93_003530 [Actinokineospora auranticolor]|uniref:Uncharacterized protein n=1 Tax=Actinokineospora auranticolor TaxID=155976 RepID=A0A2S6GPL2_9PSEU|nr:hypothetical protein [Actinokineospora auranticolor]PPK67192.1 hypothetical protein CLV40_108190 [Actinokineospora auranticolor]
MSTPLRLDLVAPSGSRLSLVMPDVGPVSSVAASVRFAGGSYGTGFQIGSRGYHEFAATHVAPATTTDRFLVHGREVVVAEARDGQSSMATLLGDYHELMTVFAGPAPRRDRVFSLFNSLRVTDDPAGMRVAARSMTLLDAMSESVVVAVKDFGSVAVPGPRQTRDHVPNHAGAPTRHGEVWKVQLPVGRSGKPGQGFLLGCAAGVAEVQFADSTARAERERLDWLDGIDVAWRKA